MKSSVISLILLLTACSAIQSSAQNNPTLQDDDLQKYTFHVKQFSTLCVQDNVNVVYNCSNDSTATIYYHAVPDFEDAFIFTDNGHTLKIQVTTEDVGKPGLPTLYVSSRFLSRVENYSDFNLRVETLKPTEEFSASLVGNGSILVNDIDAHDVNAAITTGMGTIILTGQTTNASLKLTGTGTIQADRLKCRKASCRILGGGSITTFATELLQTRGIGSTKIYYRGRPQIRRKGGGKLIPID